RGRRSEPLLLLPLRQTAGRPRDTGLVQPLLQLLQIDLNELPQPRQLLGELLGGNEIRFALRLRRSRQRQARGAQGVADALLDRHRRVLVAATQDAVAAQRTQNVAVLLLQRSRRLLPLLLRPRRV